MTESELPEVLPALPPLPRGYRWEYRGKGWRTESPRYFAFFKEGEDTEWRVMPMATRPAGAETLHYIERVIAP